MDGAARGARGRARRSLTPARELLRDDERVVAQLLLREDLGELLGLEERRERAQLALAGRPTRRLEQVDGVAYPDTELQS